MEQTIQIFGYLSLSLGLSKSQVIEKHGSYANWIKTTNQYKVAFSSYKEIDNNIEDVSDNYDFNLPIFDTPDQKHPNETLLVDIVFGHSDRRTKLKSFIEYAKQNENFKRIVLCVYDINMLGSSPRMIKENYLNLLDANIAVYFISPSSINLSTSLDRKPLPADFDKQYYINQIKHTEISPRSLTWSGIHCKKDITQSFLDAYFLYHLFLIGDEEALILSQLSKNQFPVKNKEVESWVLNAFILGGPSLPSLYRLEYEWFSDHPMLGDYYELPRRCGKVSPDILLLHKAMCLSSEQLESISKEDLINMEVTNIYDNADSISESDIDFKKIESISYKFNLPIINPPTFKRYCLRIIAATEKKYTTYYKRKNQDLCDAIHKLKEYARENNLSKAETQAEYDLFFENYYKEHESSFTNE